MLVNSRNILAQQWFHLQNYLVDDKGNIKVAPFQLLERRLIPRNNEPVVQWKIHWSNLPETEATWEDADFIRKVFPSFNP